jgi:nitrogen regulatory protein PII
MKMFMIVYEWSIDVYVIAAINEIGITGYTKWTKVLGTGPETGPKMGSHTCPCDNDMLAVVVDDKDAAKVKEMVLHLRKEHPRGGLRCFIVPVEEMI